MDVRTIPELWRVGVIKITIVQKWNPIKKLPHTEVKSIRLDVDGALPAGSTE